MYGDPSNGVATPGFPIVEFPEDDYHTQHPMISCRQLLRGVALLGALLASSCASPAESLEELLQEEAYGDALVLLEEEGVGSNPEPGAEQEALQLRARFTEEINASTQRIVEELLAQGATHRALASAQERSALCPWSEPIAQLVSRCDQMVRRIAATESKWSSPLSGRTSSPELVREFLAEITPSRPWILDSPGMRSLEEKASAVMIQGWADRIQTSNGRFDPNVAQTLAADLLLVGVEGMEIRGLQKPLSIINRLPRADAMPNQLEATALEALAEAEELLLGSGGISSQSRLAPCLAAAWGAFESWHVAAFTAMLRSESVEYQAVELAESWSSDSRFGEPLRSSLAAAHLRLGAKRAPQGIACVLALIHLKRALALGLPEADLSWQEAQRTAEATFATTPASVIATEIRLGARVDPELRSTVEFAFFTEVQRADKGLSILEASTRTGVSPDLLLTLLQAQLVSDINGVRPVNSRYFSHFEEVSNPLKESLRFQLNIADSSVSSKKSTYDWAVISHNSYPTQYSLNNANLAYSSYQMAVNYYNSLVYQFNATPATISHAVYLPYSFRQGIIRFGWTLQASASFAGKEMGPIIGESLVQDFVRLGNKGTDENEAYRMPDGVDIDVSPTGAVNHLQKAISEIKSDLYPELLELTARFVPGLSAEEQTIVGLIIHPWGFQIEHAREAGMPSWALDVASAYQFSKPAVLPPSHSLARSPQPIQGPFDPETAAAALTPFVCRTISGVGEHESSGTATLIGPDGLLLSCAHVLSGTTLKFEFSSGPWIGTYEGEIVFMNSERDVALLRAIGLQNDRWVNLRLDASTAQGEAIVAIGNPGMDIGGLNRGGISQGIVSNSNTARGSNVYLAADISIAQGSSGGPLFSLKNGDLIGVVQLVATSPGFPTSPDEVAATGFLCLAAPAQKLQEWLGLSVQR